MLYSFLTLFKVAYLVLFAQLITAHYTIQVNRICGIRHQSICFSDVKVVANLSSVSSYHQCLIAVVLLLLKVLLYPIIGA